MGVVFSLYSYSMHGPNFIHTLLPTLTYMYVYPSSNATYSWALHMHCSRVFLTVATFILTESCCSTDSRFTMVESEDNFVWSAYRNTHGCTLIKHSNPYTRPFIFPSYLSYRGKKCHFLLELSTQLYK